MRPARRRTARLKLTDTPARPLECNCLKRTSLPPCAPETRCLASASCEGQTCLTAHERSATSYAEPTRKTRPACRCYLLIARSLERISKEARSACYTDPRRTPNAPLPVQSSRCRLDAACRYGIALRSMPKTLHRRFPRLLSRHGSSVYGAFFRRKPQRSRANNPLKHQHDSMRRCDGRRNR